MKLALSAAAVAAVSIVLTVSVMWVSGLTKWSGPFHSQPATAEGRETMYAQCQQHLTEMGPPMQMMHPMMHGMMEMGR